MSVGALDALAKEALRPSWGMDFMRKRWIALLLLLICAVYWAWPLVGAYELAQVAARGDSAAVADRVNFTALRRTIASQVVHAYVRRSGGSESFGAIGKNMVVAAGVTVAEPYLADLISPEMLTRLLGDGTVKALTINNRSIVFGRALPRFSETTRSQNAISLLLNSHFDGPVSFVIHVPAKDDSSDGFGIHLRLSGTTWRLSGVDLPERLLDQIADDIAVAMKTKMAT